MTTTTEREILSPRNGRVPKLDTPAVSTRARARLPVTHRVRKGKIVVRRRARSWWGWTARPVSLAAAWRLSTVDQTRVPGKSGLLRGLWLVSNAVDRPLLFALTLIAPTWAQGPLRWTVQRPTRRWGLYLIAALLGAAWLLGGE